MLELWLGREGYVSRYKDELIGVPYQDLDGQPCVRYKFDLHSYLSGLPPINDTYKECVRQGWDEDRIMRKLIDWYVPFKLFRVGSYARQEQVIGLCGHRGSGKTCGAVSIAIFDFMLRNKQCWSNVPIAFSVNYGDCRKVFEAVPWEQINLLDLDAEKSYRGGVVVVDEANMVVASAYRSMSGANLDFAGFVQQIRKRQMSVIWTSQSFMAVDKQLRFQSDWIIACRDAHLDNSKFPIGHYADWSVYDIGGQSGLFDMEFEETHKWLFDYKCWEGRHFNRPIWRAYDTFAMADGKYIQRYKQAKLGQADLVLKDAPDAEAGMSYQEYAKFLSIKGWKEIYASELHEQLGITGDRAEIIKCGVGMKVAGWVKRQSTNGSKYFHENGTEN